MKRLLQATALIGCLWLAPQVATAATCDGVTASNTVETSAGVLTLNGMGIRKATFLKVHVYIASLYLPAKSSNGGAIVKQGKPWLLRLNFVHSADDDDIRDAWSEGFKANAGSKLASLQNRVSTLNGYMTHFKNGDTLEFFYDPKAGTKVSINGKASGTIQGEDFASVLLSIWLGSSPPNDDLKSGLLGGKCG